MEIVKIKNKYSRDEWKRILNGEELFTPIPYNRNNYHYNRAYSNFVDGLMKNVDDGRDISKVVGLKDIMKDIVYYFRVKEDFLEKYHEFLDWKLVAQFQIISCDFIEKYKDKWDWYYICSNQNLKEWIIRRHINDFNDSCWTELSTRKGNHFSDNFIREFSDFLQMDFIGECHPINKNMLREFGGTIHYGNWYHNMRKHEVMTQEETLEFTAGYYDKNQMGLTIAEVSQGVNYDYSPY